MKYRYSLQHGLKQIKNNTKKYTVGAITTVAITVGMTVPAIAAQPANQGCFGADRAAYANTYGSLGKDPGGVGYYASQRAGDNGTINQAYKTSCGGDPTQ